MLNEWRIEAYIRDYAGWENGRRKSKRKDGRNRWKTNVDVFLKYQKSRGKDKVVLDTPRGRQRSFHCHAEIDHPVKVNTAGNIL